MDESAVLLDEGEQQAAARQFEIENFRRRQEEANQKVAKRNEQRRRSGITSLPQELAAQGIQAEAERLWAFAWSKVQLGVETFCSAFFFAGSLIGGPVAIFLYGTRVVVGTFFGGGSRIPPPIFVSGLLPSMKVTVPLVPPMDAAEWIIRTSQIAWISVLTFIIYGAIFIAAYIFTHPEQTAQLALYASWCWLSNLFGNPCGPL